MKRELLITMQRVLGIEHDLALAILEQRAKMLPQRPLPDPS